MARAKPELDRLVLDTAASVMRARGIQQAPELGAALSEEGLGLDSMARIELLQALEVRAGVSIPEQYWDGRKLKTLEDTARLLARLGA